MRGNFHGHHQDRRKAPVGLFVAASLAAVFGLLLVFLTLAPAARNSPPSRGSFRRRNPTRLAYFITGGAHGDGARIRRLVMALYHPWNYYLIHFDASASEKEREKVSELLRSQAALREFGNVRMLEKSDAVSLKGPTAVSCTLHGVAFLLREFGDWSWFINLSSSDYPLMSQDDILHIFSYMPRGLNFIEHTSDLGWKENERARPMIIDPALYNPNRTNIFWIKDKRSVPSSFKLFVGSSGAVLGRPFLEFCTLGWDNLPRTLLMYFTNFPSSSESYFQTVICNSNHFHNTTVNSDLRFTPPPQYTAFTRNHFDTMADSGAPFAHSLTNEDGNDDILTTIDTDLLRRVDNQFTPGGWCLGRASRNHDPCSTYTKLFVLRPTRRARRLEEFMRNLLAPENFRPKQCK